MLNRERIISTFIELISVDSPSLKERNMFVLLRQQLEQLGFAVYEDEAAQKIGGECGNLIATWKGEPSLPVIGILAHMDTVEPCYHKKGIVDGDVIRSDGTTILGGDDAAGIVVALETVRQIQENGIRHGDIQLIFTVAEEIGLLGAKNLDYSKINAQYLFVLDSGDPIHTVVAQAPSHVSMSVRIVGKAAHAGVHPEKGISAVQVFADAVSRMKLGRIDDETTANIGVVRGGTAKNIVCETIEVEAEARSRNDEKLEKQVAHMETCFFSACEKFNAKLEFTKEVEYRSFSLNEDDAIIKLLRNAAHRLGRELLLQPTGGGSDTNILNERGMAAVNLPVGMYEFHSTAEYTNICHMEMTIELLTEIFKENVRE